MGTKLDRSQPKSDRSIEKVKTEVTLLVRSQVA